MHFSRALIFTNVLSPRSRFFQFPNGGTYCILLVLVIGLDLYGHGLIGAAITGAAEPRPRPREPSGLFLLVLGDLLVLRGRAVNVYEIVAARRRLEHGLLGGQG